MKTIRIALAQINPIVGDLAGNTAKIISYIQQARAAGSQLVVFPELAVCGYPPEDLIHKPYFVRKNKEQLKKIALHCKNITAVVGFADLVKGQAYNAAAILHKKKLIHSYHKMELPNYGVFDEKRYFIPGREGIIFRENELSWTVNICEDIWSKKLKYTGLDLILNISASPYHRKKQLERERILKTKARSFQTTIVYCNMVGGQDELVFDGASVIVSPRGKILARGKQFAEDLVIADLTIPKSKKKNNIAKKHFNLKLSQAPRKKIKQTEISTPLAPLAEIYSALTLGLRDYVLKNKFQKVIFGLSGGIDSTLTALIAADSLGRDNVITLSLPSHFTSRQTLTDKKKLAHNLGIKLITVPITDIFEKYLQVLKPFFKGKGWDVTEENIQARIRGNILMAFSNKFGYLVLTTGNKSENSVGYCTLYGDMAGGFNVLKDVPKGLVYKLARYRDKQARGILVPKKIFTRPPTAELREGQKDQDSLPPYPLLDKIIDAYVEQNKSLAEIIKAGIPAKTAREMIRLIDRNEYKRRQAPPGIKITPKSFGKDRRMPITHRIVT